MSKFRTIQNNKRLFLVITSLALTINFRTTFKNIDAHMDLGSYSTLKFDPIIILIKNAFCCAIHLIIFWYSLKKNTTKTKDKILIKNETANFVSYGFKEKEERNSLLDILFQSHELNTPTSKFLFWLKVILIIIVIYIIEELYFMIGNNHILDRLVVCMRNVGILIPTFLLSSLLIKKNWKFNKHQLYPCIIIIFISLFMIIYNASTVQRFNKIFNINFLYYLSVYVLTGVELVLIKYLVDVQFINVFLILGIKGLIGTITFGIINLLVNRHNFIYFFSEFLSFENEENFEDFSILFKIFYIISFLLVQFLKIEIIQIFTESHFLSSAMISDVFYFPFYLIEKFAIQNFPISTTDTFYINNIIGIINTILLLIFNEIIEIKCCDVAKNTNINIDQRQETEIVNLNKDLDNIKNNSEILEESEDSE